MTDVKRLLEVQKLKLRNLHEYDLKKQGKHDFSNAFLDHETLSKNLVHFELFCSLVLGAVQHLKLGGWSAGDIFDRIMGLGLLQGTADGEVQRDSHRWS